MVWGLVGAILYEVFLRALFGVSLLGGLREWVHSDRSSFFWGMVLLVSVAIGGWCVADAARHGLKLIWKWVRLFEVGGK